MKGEKHTQTILEKKYMKKRRTSTYVALEELNFFWDLKEVMEFDRMWNDGHSLHSISNHFNRNIEECAILLMDRSEKGYCKPRKSGIF